MSPRAQAHLASLCEKCDEAIRRRQDKQRRTLREVEIRDQLVAVMRDICEHQVMDRPLMMRATIAQGRELVEELDQIHAEMIFVREAA